MSFNAEFIEPSPTDARKGALPRVVTETTAPYFEPNPELLPDYLEQAARQALEVAQDHGFAAVAFASVSTLIQADRYQGGIEYVYLWQFDAVRPISEREEDEESLGDVAQVVVDGGTVAVIGTRRESAQRIAEELVALCPQAGIKHVKTNGNEHYRFPNGARVLVGSGTGAWLRGTSLDYLVLDRDADDNSAYWLPCFAGREPRMLTY